MGTQFNFILKQFLSSLFLTFILVLSCGIFMLFRPFNYIDHYQSKLICSTGISANSGPAAIYSFDGTLDEFSQVKALKVCAYNIVFDYYNQFALPSGITYKFQPKIVIFSSWYEAIFAVSVFSLIVIELLILSKIDFLENFGNMMRYDSRFGLFFIMIHLVISGLFYWIVFSSPIQKIYCQNLVRIQIKDFSRSINLSGKEYPNVEYDWAKKNESKYVKKCLTDGFLINGKN
ncbi:hypothetical protein A3J15_03900 [Candidatus Roizmanbacteria bacterium RIFCSPLOWO2_02_FULL_38_10]|uniref:Uncharacterized protein n=1 Tax=Candidatus Roizmanbacteria bacterium RIFCSPLOWO2_02_FULL_38_10 TaxID=1802074 RepID=A0A1F7JM61_9BACT|nr:MAG: hypothetical protein A3J15_03900 [Candidatus Roizmanbacteria bacterium RIFCSPLOWO2_02_FULL_38_10]